MRAGREEHRRGRALHRNSVRQLLKVLTAGPERRRRRPDHSRRILLNGLGAGKLFGRARRGLVRKVRALDEVQLPAFFESATAADTLPDVRGLGHGGVAARRSPRPSVGGRRLADVPPPHHASAFWQPQDTGE